MKDEGPKEMTLDEWKAMQDKDRAKVEFNIRKVKEGEDWNKGFVLHKSKAEVGQVVSLGVGTNKTCFIFFIYKKCRLQNAELGHKPVITKENALLCL